MTLKRFVIISMSINLVLLGGAVVFLTGGKSRDGLTGIPANATTSAAGSPVNQPYASVHGLERPSSGQVALQGQPLFPQEPVPANAATTIVDNAAAQSGGVDVPAVAQNEPVRVPLIFVSSNVKQMDEVQQNAVTSLQARFVAEVGDPNAPDYKERWAKAQDQMDDEFRAQFGIEAYNEFQRAREASPPQNSTATR